jgi:hypothetical protein
VNEGDGVAGVSDGREGYKLSDGRERGVLEPKEESLPKDMVPDGQGNGEVARKLSR